MAEGTERQFRERRKSARAAMKAKMSGVQDRLSAAADQYNYDEWSPENQAAFKTKTREWGQGVMEGIKDIYRSNAEDVKANMRAKLAELEAQAGRPLTDEEKRQHIRQALANPETQDKVRQWFADTKSQARDYASAQASAAKGAIRSQAPGFTPSFGMTPTPGAIPPAPPPGAPPANGYVPWDASFGVVDPNLANSMTSMY